MVIQSIFLSLLMVPISAFCLTTLYTGKEVLSASPYLLLNKNINHLKTNTGDEALPHYDARFPVKSDLTPGEVQARRLPMDNLPFPYFVVGVDEFSMNWLKGHCMDLQALKAIGLVTNIESDEQLKEVESACAMTFLPVDLTEFGKALAITHYPFLVSQKGVEQ